LTDISETGDILPNTYIDEWGRRRINGSLEDGTRILIVAAAPILKIWTALLNTGHVFSRPSRFMKLTQALNTGHVYLRHRYMQLSQTLRTLHAWMLPIPTFLKKWLATLQISHVFNRPFRRIGYTQQLQPTHLFSRPSRFMKLVERLTLGHAYFMAVPGAKKTRLFLVIGDLAIQLSND
jgi:hypothetical protein